MPRIAPRVTNIQKLAIDKRIKPSAYGIHQATGISYELVRRTLNGESPSDKTMATLMSYFGVEWGELFELEEDDSTPAPTR